MGDKVIQQRKRLAALFVSFTILAIGTASLWENMSIDYYSVLSTVQKILPASIVLGGIGWLMGMILDKPKMKKALSSPNINNVFFSDVMGDDLQSPNLSDGLNIENPLDS